MHPQLLAVENELASARLRLDRLVMKTPDSRLIQPPVPGGWSAAQCIKHLNMTSQVFIPELEAAVEEAATLNDKQPARLRRSFLGWMLWKGISQPGKMKMKTSETFEPVADVDFATEVEEFNRHQSHLIHLVRECDGKPIHRVKVASPFSKRMSYDLYAALTIIAGHQHRHLWQAEQAVLVLES